MNNVYWGSQDFPILSSSLVLALGNFDGVHLAHQTLIKMAVMAAKKCSGIAYAYTFEPHPVKVLSKAAAPLMINTLEQKIELLQALGIHGVIIEKFDMDLAKLSAQDWFQKIILQRLHAAVLISGYDFTFGHQRSGTVETLHQFCEQAKIDCQMLPAQVAGETLISSTQVRHFLLKGEIAFANQLLGYPFFIDGQVIAGAGRGKQLGYPTANLKTLNELIPPRGVYICRARLKNQWFDAVTNIGTNPTFGGQTLSIETYLLDFSQEIYNNTLRLQFYQKLREEKTFSSAKELTEQIALDIQKTRDYFVSMSAA